MATGKAPKVGAVLVVSYAGRDYEATVLRVTAHRFLGRFVTGTGPKRRWFYWKLRYGTVLT